MDFFVKPQTVYDCFWDVLRTSLARNSHFEGVCILYDIFEAKTKNDKDFMINQNWRKNKKIGEFFQKICFFEKYSNFGVLGDFENFNCNFFYHFWFFIKKIFFFLSTHLLLFPQKISRLIANTAKMLSMLNSLRMGR